MSHQAELFDFLVHRLIHSNREDMYDIIQFWSDMVMEEEEERMNGKRLHCLYIDGEGRRILHERMCRWFDGKMLDIVCQIQKGIKNEENEKEAIKNALMFRARYLVGDIASGRITTAGRKGEEDERRKGKELAQGKGKGKEKEPTRSSPEAAAARSGVSDSSAPPERQDLLFVSDRQSPECALLLKELFYRSGMLSLNDISLSFGDKENDPGISASDLRAYLNSLEDADAGAFNPSP